MLCSRTGGECWGLVEVADAAPGRRPHPACSRNRKVQVHVLGRCQLLRWTWHILHRARLIAAFRGGRAWLRGGYSQVKMSPSVSWSRDSLPARSRRGLAVVSRDFSPQLSRMDRLPRSQRSPAPAELRTWKHRELWEILTVAKHWISSAGLEQGMISAP